MISIKFMWEKLNTMCLWKTSASDNDQFQRWLRSQEQYFDTSRKILSRIMTICIVDALVFILFFIFFLEIMTNAICL